MQLSDKRSAALRWVSTGGRLGEGRTRWTLQEEGPLLTKHQGAGLQVLLRTGRPYKLPGRLCASLGSPAGHGNAPKADIAGASGHLRQLWGRCRSA